jgi:hypothetical protein
MGKALKNHRLINYLADHRLVEMVSVNKQYVIATLTKRCKPSDFDVMMKEIGQMPQPRRNGDNYMAVFKRFPDKEKSL